jgi:hypothetical protein
VYLSDSYVMLAQDGKTDARFLPKKTRSRSRRQQFVMEGLWRVEYDIPLITSVSVSSIAVHCHLFTLYVSIYNIIQS